MSDDTQILAEAMAITRDIRDQFPSTEMPSDVRDRLETDLRNLRHPETLEALRTLHSAGSWSTLPLEAARSLHPCPLRVPGPAFEYFLPAYMIASLDEETQWEFASALVDLICPTTAANEPVRLGIDVSKFTSGQRRCIFDFLRWCQKYTFESFPRVQHRIERALPVIWEPATP